MKGKQNNSGFGFIVAAVIIAAIVGGTITVWKYSSMKTAEYDAKAPLYAGMGEFLGSLGQNMLLIVAVIAAAIIIKAWISRRPVQAQQTAPQRRKSSSKKGPRLIGMFFVLLLSFALIAPSASALSESDTKKACDSGTSFYVGFFKEGENSVFSMITQQIVIEQNITIKSISLKVGVDESKSSNKLSSPPSLRAEFGPYDTDKLRYTSDQKKDYTNNVLYITPSDEHAKEYEPYSKTVYTSAEVTGPGILKLKLNRKLTPGTYVLTLRTIVHEVSTETYVYTVPHTSDYMNKSSAILDEADFHTKKDWWGQVEYSYSAHRILFSDDIVLIFETGNGTAFGGWNVNDDETSYTSLDTVIAVSLLIGTALLFYFRRYEA